MPLRYRPGANTPQTGTPAPRPPSSDPRKIGIRKPPGSINKGSSQPPKMKWKQNQGGGKKRTPNKAFLEASARWRAHLAEFRKAHPNMPLKKAMKEAKKTYKKSKPQPIVLKNTRYSVEIRNRSTRTKPKKARKTKRKKKSKKSKKLFGLF